MGLAAVVVFGVVAYTGTAQAFAGTSSGCDQIPTRQELQAANISPAVYAGGSVDFDKMDLDAINLEPLPKPFAHKIRSYNRSLNSDGSGAQVSAGICDTVSYVVQRPYLGGLVVLPATVWGGATGIIHQIVLYFAVLVGVAAATPRTIINNISQRIGTNDRRDRSASEPRSIEELDADSREVRRSRRRRLYATVAADR